jgi:hypothetical protein
MPASNVVSSWFAMPQGTTVFGIVFLLGLVALVLLPRTYRAIEHKFIRFPIYIVALTVCLIDILVSAGYLITPYYSDHVEPTVAVSSALLLRGQSLYPDWNTGEGVYGMIYGPVLYFINAMVLIANKSIFATKFAGVAAAWTALLIMTLNARLIVRDYAITSLAMGCVCLVFLTLMPSQFWNRPEPFLILLSALSGLALRLPIFKAGFAIGIITGLAVGLKPHGVFYCLPAAAALLERQSSPWMSRVQLASVIFATAVAVMIAPFLHPAVSLSRYLAYLEIAAEHGLRLDLFIQNIVFLALIMTPGITIYFFKRPMLLHEFPLSIPVLITSGIITAAVGAKNGAGVHHMLPLVPAVTLATLQIAQLKSQDPSALISRQAAALSFFVAYFVAFMPVVVDQSLWMVRAIVRASSEWPKIVELDQLYGMHTRAEMGTTDNANYRSTYYRVVGVLRGGPVHLEVPFLIDLHAVGLGDDAIRDLLQHCKVAEWILPQAGNPFSQRNSYNGNELFSDGVRHAFDNNYRLISSGTYYNVWGCR